MSEYIMNNIAREIVPLSFLALMAFFMWGVGYLIMHETEVTRELQALCIEAGKQVVEGNCIDSGRTISYEGS